jgi:carboxyl-terminal processing protease
MTREANNQAPKKRTKIILGALFVLTFIMGWVLGQQDAKFGKIGFTPNLIGQNSEEANVDFSIFWRTWDLISEKYDGEINYQNLVYGAVRGMTEALGDPYTSFLTPEEAEYLESDLSGVFYGIGTEIGIKNDQLTIVAPLEGTPASEAGLKSGDIVTHIDGENTTNMELDVAVFKIRGKEGTKVKLTILRDGETSEIAITRAKIVVESIEWEVKENNIGYVSVRRFDENTTYDLRAALDDLISKNITKVVLDLRDNPGGYLDESITVASEFIDEGVVVTERKDTDSETSFEYKSTGRGKMTDEKYKIIVLVNEGSASASEIVAGALKDYNRATIVGEKTFGKGSVQELESLSGGAKLRVTVAHWYTPNGENITEGGITPDVLVELTEEDWNAGKDPQLLKALKLLK